jgi:cytochrome c
MSRMMLLTASLVVLFSCETAAAQDEPAAAQGDEGVIAFNNHCRNCHSFKPDDNRIGPSLNGVVGKPAGQVKGYTKYSGALNGLTWDEATLDKFITDPQSVAPGTNMSYPPVHDAAERKKIIEFLKSNSSG